MQAVLSIDMTSDPAMLEVVEVNGRSLKVLERHSAQLTELLERLSPSLTASPAAGSPDTSPSGQVEPPAPAESRPPEESSQVDPLGIALREIKTPWTNSIVVVSSNRYLSLNLDLPFSDHRNIAKVLPVEIQDRVPFDVGEFLVEHRVVNSREKNQFDIHVGIVPRHFMQHLLSLCRRNEFEPMVVSTPTSALAALYQLAPDYFAPDSAIILANDPHFYITMSFDGVVSSDRTIDRRLCSVEDTASVITELKLTIAAYEERYKRQVKQVYVVGDSLDIRTLSQQLGRTAERIQVAEIIKGAAENELHSKSSIATLAALFAQDTPPAEPLTNLRVQEFSYSPRLQGLLAALRSLVPYILATLLCGLIAVGGIYAVRQHRLEKIQQAVRSQIRREIPDLTVAAGLEVDALRGEIVSLQNKLKDLGTLSKMTPLDAFVQLTKDFPSSATTAVRALNIKNNRIKIEGSAPDYNAAESIEKALKNKRQTYCRLKSTFDGGGTTIPGGGRPFSLEIFLCE